jgi:hypothetical protein
METWEMVDTITILAEIHKVKALTIRSKEAIMVVQRL